MIPIQMDKKTATNHQKKHLIAELRAAFVVLSPDRTPAWRSTGLMALEKTNICR